MHLRRPGKDIDFFVDLDFQRHILEKGLEKILFIVLQRRLTSYETHAQRWETFFLSRCGRFDFCYFYLKVLRWSLFSGYHRPC